MENNKQFEMLQDICNQLKKAHRAKVMEELKSEMEWLDKGSSEYLERKAEYLELKEDELNEKAEHIKTATKEIREITGSILEIYTQLNERESRLLEREACLNKLRILDLNDTDIECLIKISNSTRGGVL